MNKDYYAVEYNMCLDKKAIGISLICPRQNELYNDVIPIITIVREMDIANWVLETCCEALNAKLAAKE